MDTENNSDIVINNFEINDSETENSNSDIKINNYLDLENNDLESDKCVICFESIIDSSLNNDLFICSHAKNFHYDCVKTLNNCPCCRAPFTRTSYYIPVHELQSSCFSKPFFFGCLCGSFMLWLLFLMICNPSLGACRGLYESNYHTLNITDVNSTSL